MDNLSCDIMYYLIFNANGYEMEKKNGEKGSDDTKVYISTIFRLNYENVPTVLFFPLLFTWHNFV